MERDLACAFAAIATAACSPDAVTPAAKLPPVANPAEAGEVVLMRPRAFIAEPVSESERRKLLSRTAVVKVLH
jgi:hypothetical protein